MSLVLKHGYFYISEKEENETAEELFGKSWFVVSQLRNNDKVENIEKYARLWKNNKVHECKYDDVIMDKLNKMETNLYSVSATFNH